MPEGHSLHRIARGLTAAFAGQPVRVSSPQGRFADGAAQLDGRRCLGAWAHGKLLFIDLARDAGEAQGGAEAAEPGPSLYVHLGLIGKWFFQHREPGLEPPVTGVVRARLLGERYVADLRGPMACAVVDPAEVDALVARQGPDPLQSSSDLAAAPVEGAHVSFERAARSGRSVAALLMDQSIIAGVGNIYRCEVLWRHRVNPATPGRRVRFESWKAMWDDLVVLMRWGVRTGTIITLDDVLDDARAAYGAGLGPGVNEQILRGLVDGPPVDVPREYAVYQRDAQPCLRCGATVRMKVLAGRHLFWCGGCQRRS